MKKKQCSIENVRITINFVWFLMWILRVFLCCVNHLFTRSNISIVWNIICECSYTIRSDCSPRTEFNFIANSIDIVEHTVSRKTATWKMNSAHGGNVQRIWVVSDWVKLLSSIWKHWKRMLERFLLLILLSLGLEICRGVLFWLMFLSHYVNTLQK